MKRTQIQLDEPTYDVLRSQAFRRGISMAALIRELLHKQLGLSSTRARRLDDLQFIGSGRSAESELDPISEKHDEALAEDFAR